MLQHESRKAEITKLKSGTSTGIMQEVCKYTAWGHSHLLECKYRHRIIVANEKSHVSSIRLLITTTTTVAFTVILYSSPCPALHRVQWHFRNTKHTTHLRCKSWLAQSRPQCGQSNANEMTFTKKKKTMIIRSACCSSYRRRALEPATLEWNTDCVILTSLVTALLQDNKRWC